MTTRLASVGTISALLFFAFCAAAASADTCPQLKHQTELGISAAGEAQAAAKAGRSADASAAAQRFNQEMTDAQQFTAGCQDADIQITYFVYEFQKDVDDFNAASPDLKPQAARIGYGDLRLMTLFGMADKLPKTYAAYVQVTQQMYARTNQSFTPPALALPHTLSQTAQTPTAASAAAAAAAAAAARPAAASRTVFTGPAGWTRHDTPVPGGLAWEFYPPNSYGTGPHVDMRRQTIPTAWDLTQLAKLSREMAVKLAGGSALKADHAEMLCGGTKRGWFFEYLLKRDDSTTIDSEQVIGMAPGAGYIVSYGRVLGAPEDPAVRASLDSLCPR